MLIEMIRNVFSGQSIDMASIVSQILATLFIIFCILPLHECAHGWVAYKLGDNTAKYNGRLTLNPLASLDTFGALAMLLFGFGWAKPVPVDARRFKNPKRDMAITALAGPVSNLLAAIAGLIIFAFIYVFYHETFAVNIQGGFYVQNNSVVPHFINMFFIAYISLNVGLAVFNLIPVPPLDGSRIVGAFLSDKALYKYYQYQQYIVIGLFVILYLGVLNVPMALLNNSILYGISQISSLIFKIFGLL